MQVQSSAMARKPANPDLSAEERAREQARERMRRMRMKRAAGGLPPDIDVVRRALVSAASDLPEDVRLNLLNAMLQTVEEDRREGFRTMGRDLLKLDADTTAQ